MKKHFDTLSKLVVGLTILSLAVIQPVSIAMAADTATTDSSTPPASDQTTQPSTPAETSLPTTSTDQNQPVTGPTSPVGPMATPGPQKPNGADSNTYTYNSDTGMWENDQYIWDPTTRQTRPKEVPDYFYNPSTGTWSTKDWAYDPASGKYQPVVRTVSPELVAALGLDPQKAALLDNDPSISNTGPGSNNQISNHDTANGAFNLFSRSEIANYFNMNSLTGNAGVSGNTQAGDATSGSAATAANILNLLRSAWSITGGNLVTFFQNFFGDMNGDILLDTGQGRGSGALTALGGVNDNIANTGPSSNNTIDSTKDGDLSINSTSLNSIDNNLKLNSQTGAASVDGNTIGGSARSGDAAVLLNLINLISSAISSRQSFFGVLNIFGNLNGDILFPPGFLESVLASSSSGSPNGNQGRISNTGPSSNNTITASQQSSLLANTNSVDSINNNINTSAQSGSADVSGNTQAGSATSGDVNAKVTLLNLTGRQVIAKNAILVFVNVFGRWVGLIMNAPQGSNSALVGGGVASNSVLPAGNTTLNATTQNTINNNIDLSARSGDVSVTNNTQAGSATSGRADIAANIGNIIDSNFSLSDWFGVLFINVFGNWVGSFGVDTAAGNPPAAVEQAAINQLNQSVATSTKAASNSSSVSEAGAAGGGLLNSIIQNNTANSSLNGNPYNQTSPVNSVNNFKKSTGLPLSSYLWPIFALAALLVASVLYKFSKE
ncbi:hypothetical protein HYX70_03640 [Candidatus Saccharibacteria bacterium]|nr:hypothetical protein [Candidatus Saccharibacteria bacterium]